MSMADLTVKSLRMAAKNGLTKDGILKKFHLTETQFNKKMNEFYGAKKNSKSKHEVMQWLEQNEKNAPNKVEDANEPTDTPSDFYIPTPEELLEDCSAQAQEMEKEYQSLREERRIGMAKIRESIKEYNDLISKAQSIRATIENIAQKDGEFTIRMNELAQRHRCSQLTIARLRESIRLKQTITIAVCTDGSIIPLEDEKNIVLIFDGYEEVAKDLLLKVDSDLRKTTLIQLAKLYIATKNLDMPFELCFDDEEETKKVWENFLKGRL